MADASCCPVTRILSAANCFARLDLSLEPQEVQHVRSQYRRLALAVHPDKCQDPKAKEAFQALSEAFEQLSSEAGQAQLLRELQHRSGSCPGVATRTRARARPRRREEEKDDTKAHWWDTNTWEEFEERLRHRERAEAALNKRYCGNLRVKFMTRKVRGFIFDAERSVEHLDRQKELPESFLWPPESTQAARDLEAEVQRLRQTELYPGQANEMLPDYRERLELNDPGLAIQRLLELMTHLRTVHLYCLYCGCTYDSSQDMERNCPGITEEEHDEAKSMGLRDSAETQIEVPEAQAPGDDPLETFMASIDVELQSQKKRKTRR